jgi:hypothetical protein
MAVVGRSSARHPYCLSLVALVLFVLTAGAVWADVGSTRRPLALLTPGPSFEIGLDGSLRFGGEVALAQYMGGWGFGAAVGFVPGRFYVELQPAAVLGSQPHNIILGANPGFVVDLTGDIARYGGQLTLWANYAHTEGRDRPWALPLFPFLRAQAVAGVGFTFTGGLMLKLPVPVS